MSRAGPLAVAEVLIKVIVDEKGSKKQMALPFPEVPVMAILKEWRLMGTRAGPLGRYAHRPQHVPKYEYEKHRSSLGP